MLRSAMLLAALISSLSLAQAQNKQTDRSNAQSREIDQAASAATGQRTETPYPDMMKAWEYSAQEWK